MVFSCVVSLELGMLTESFSLQVLIVFTRSSVACRFNFFNCPETVLGSLMNLASFLNYSKTRSDPFFKLDFGWIFLTLRSQLVIYMNTSPD